MTTTARRTKTANRVATTADSHDFPTRPYDRDNPDKYRIDPWSGEIPFDWTLKDY